MALTGGHVAGDPTHVSDHNLIDAALAVTVRTVNSVAPDGAGNVVVAGGGINTADVGYDIVLLAGQSNMSGRGTIDSAFDPTVNAHVWQYATAGTVANVVALAVDPLGHADRVALTNTLGPGTSFARWYASTIPGNRQVLLVPTAYGGTGFTTSPTWDPAVGAGSLYLQAIAQTNAAITAAGANARLVGVLWLQGEADISMTQAAYAAKLDALIDGFRSSITGASATTPFVVGQMAPEFVSSQAGASNIQAAHTATPTRKPYTAFAPGVTGQSDGMHYNGVGQRFMGRSFLTAFLKAAANTATAGVPAVVGVTVPAQVTGLSATPGNAQNVLAWTAPSNGGSTITGYSIYRSTTSGTETLLTTQATTATTFTDTALTNGIAYFYKVAAVNAVGTGTQSTEASGTPASSPTAPAQVTGLAAAPGNALVTLSWTAPSNGGSAITGYSIYRSITTGTETLLTTPAGTATTYTDTALTNGTTYFYKVAAVNAVGTGTQSVEASAVPAVPVSPADAFTRADSVVTLGSTTTGAVAWQPLTGTWGIKTNAATLITATNAGGQPYNIAVVNGTSADGTVQATMAQAVSDGCGLAVRATDLNNYWLFRLSAANAYQIYKVVAGSPTSAGSGTLTQTASGNIIKLVMSGNSITPYVNGVAGTTVTDAFNATATKHGLWDNGTSAAGTGNGYLGVGAFDDFSCP